MQKKIFLVEDDTTIRLLVSKQLSKFDFEVITAVDGKEALEMVKAVNPDLILLDVMLPYLNGFDVCRTIKKDKDLSTIPIIIFTTLDTVEEKIKGFDVGADDYVPKTIHPKELVARINILIRNTTRQNPLPPSTSRARLISLFSMRGGVGVTSLAANIAVGLSQLGGDTVLVDLVLKAGQSSLLLNLPNRKSWANISGIPLSEIDEELIEFVLIQHDSGLKLLAAPSEFELGELINVEKIKFVLNALQKNHEYIVLDLPHDFTQETLTALEMSDEIIFILTPEMASLRSAHSVLKVFDKVCISRDKIHLIINWTFERGGLARKDIENVLKLEVKNVIPFAPEPIIRGVNLGKPVVFEDPESPLGAIFEDLAMIFTTDFHKSQEKESQNKNWIRAHSRLMRRQNSK